MSELPSDPVTEPIKSHILNINQELLCCIDIDQVYFFLNQQYSPNTVTEGVISYQVQEQVFWEDHHPIKENK